MMDYYEASNEVNNDPIQTMDMNGVLSDVSHRLSSLLKSSHHTIFRRKGKAGLIQETRPSHKFGTSLEIPFGTLCRAGVLPLPIPARG